MPIGFDDIVGEVMTSCPAAIRVFLDFRIGCVGCPISAFHTVDDACREHGIDRVHGDAWGQLGDSGERNQNKACSGKHNCLFHKDYFILNDS